MSILWKNLMAKFVVKYIILVTTFLFTLSVNSMTLLSGNEKCRGEIYDALFEYYSDFKNMENYSSYTRKNWSEVDASAKALKIFGKSESLGDSLTYCTGDVGFAYFLMTKNSKFEVVIVSLVKEGKWKIHDLEHHVENSVVNGYIKELKATEKLLVREKE